MPALNRLRARRPAACNRAVLAAATAETHATLADTFELSPTDLVDKTVVIVGAGVSGLTAAYKIKSSSPSATVVVLEAADHVGGRCLSLRNNNSFTEDKTAELVSEPAETQTVHLRTSPGERTDPYLNAGPGRIPSSHVNLLHFLREFGVALEVYIMESESNLTQVGAPSAAAAQNGREDGPTWPYNGRPVVNRRLIHNARGWLADMVYHNATALVTDLHNRNNPDDPADLAEQAELLKDFMIKFGDLTENGEYKTSPSGPGETELPGSDRAGYLTLPTVDPGAIAPPLELSALLESTFWDTGIYQPKDMLWQPSLFQPVGGMDRVAHAFESAAASAGAIIQTSSPVTKIMLNAATDQYVVKTSEMEYTADYVLCNLAIPFLEDIVEATLSERFDTDFKDGLEAVYCAQQNSEETNRFLAYTTKVGWQAERRLWEEVEIKTEGDAKTGMKKRTVRPNELGVVPIYGGISWTSDPITQIWYPSTDYHAKYGVLTGCYNFGANAKSYGDMAVSDRLEHAREGASLFSEEFANGLENGVAIAWQKMPYIKGGWAQWHAVFGENDVDDDTVEDRRADVFNNLEQGTSSKGDDKPTFFIIGDQMSSLPGWQEGAVAAALNAISRMANPTVKIRGLKRLPDTRLMVEGI